MPEIYLYFLLSASAALCIVETLTVRLNTIHKNVVMSLHLDVLGKKRSRTIILQKMLKNSHSTVKAPV